MSRQLSDVNIGVTAEPAVTEEIRSVYILQVLTVEAACRAERQM